MQSIVLVGLRLLAVVAVLGLGAWPDAHRRETAVTSDVLQVTAVECPAVASSTATPAPEVRPTATPTLWPRPQTGKVESFALISGETTLSYTATQVLLSQDNRVEVVTGKTGEVSGQFSLNYDDPRASSFGLITASLNLLQSGNQERDAALRDSWLELARFPLAHFWAREVLDFPPDFRAAEPTSFRIAGDLTIRGVTRPAVWDTTAALYLDRLKGSATTVLRLSDFGIPLLAVPGLIQVSDEVTVTLQYVFKMVEPPPLPSGA